jgi:tight adherence protein C
MGSTGGPTLLGVDVIMVATMLSAVATLAVLFALYMATTVRDPMAGRVKALNDRREQLKARHHRLDQQAPRAAQPEE